MSFLYGFYTQTFPPSAKWGPDDIPDLTGRVVVVTGGYAGIGTWTVKALLSHNAKVYIAGRDQSKASKTIGELKTETSKEAHFLKMDLGNLKSIKAAAEELASKEQAVHILFNNAGVMFPAIENLTSDGYDLQWGTNVLGHFYFTNLLHPLLAAGAASSPDGKARVIHTASSAADSRSGINFNTFRDGQKRTKKGTHYLYFQSKLGNVLVSNAMARKWAADNIISVSLNPGNLKSELQRHSSGLVKFVFDLITYPAHFGALTQLWAGTSAEGIGFNGKYLWPWARVGKCAPQAADEKLQDEVWKWLEEQVKDV